MKAQKEGLLRRYSDLFAECHDKEVQKLYYLLSLFFAKCDGLVSSSEVERLAENSAAIPFDPYQTPTSRRDMILVRLKFLKKYRVDNPQEIIRVLTWGLFTTEKLNPSDIKYLAEFTENPCRTFSWFSNRLHVSTSSVFEAYRRLQDRIHFRFNSFLNYPLLKLTHFVVFFKPNEEFKSSMLTKEFTLTVNKDTLGEWMWASFIVPNQSKTLREFTDGLKRLGYHAFDDHRLYEVKSASRSCNFSMFDGEKWISSEDALSVGSVRFGEQARGILPRFNESKYAERQIRFDSVDFVIACLRYGNALEKNSQIRSVLNQRGYVLSGVTISKRLALLKKAGVFIPTFGFAGLGLTAALAFAVECDDYVAETLYYAFPQFPDCTASRTDKGVIFMVRSSPESAPAISYLLQSSLADRVNRVIVTNRLENIGTSIPIGLHKYWSKERQYWKFENGFFDLSRKVEG